MVYLLTIQTEGKQILPCTAAICYSTAQHTVGRGLKKDIIIIKIYIYIYTQRHIQTYVHNKATLPDKKDLMSQNSHMNQMRCQQRQDQE